MPSTEHSDDELREIAREESRSAVQSAVRGLIYLVVGLAVGFVGYSLVSMALFAIDPLIAGVATLALLTLAGLLVLTSLRKRL